MRTLVSVIMAMLIVLTTSSTKAANTFQRFESGRVDYIRKDRIIVSGITYPLADNVAVVRHYKKGDSLYETRASLSEVTAGTPVVVMVIGTKVYEIMIERW